MSLYVHEWGDPGAPVAVCLHGVEAHGRRFRKLAEERLAFRYRVVAPDLRGHGRSEWEPPWDLDAHLADLLALGIERAVWIGHSFGGRLVLELLARAPGRVERAVLLDPAVWVPPPIALEHAERQRLDVSFADVEEAMAWKAVSSRLDHTPRELLEEEMSDHLVACADGRFRFRYCRSAVVAAFGEMAKPAPLAPVPVPTLLVRGAETDVVPDVLVDVCREELGPLLEIAEVPGGHILLWDAFDETAAAIERFLNRV